MSYYTEYIVKALKNLENKSDLKNIYSEVERLLKEDERLIVSNIEGVIRRELQQHSSDTKSFKKTNDDLFYPEEGLGKGIWSLKRQETVNHKKVARKQESDLETFFMHHLDFDGPSEKNLVYQAFSKSRQKKLYRGEIDVIVKHGDYLFICECKSGKDAKDKFHKWSDDKSRHLSYLMSDKIQESHKRFKVTDPEKVIFIYDIYMRPEAYDYCKMRVEEDSSGVYKNSFIWNREIQKYYRDEAKLTDKKIARNWLLKYCGINTPTKPLSVPATRIEYGDNSESYLFTVDPKEFIEFAYVARRTPEHSSNNYYQRLLKGSRLKEIASNYLEDEKGYFPNSIIVNIQDNEAISFKKSKDSPLMDGADYGILDLNKRCACFIIDGQHRLFSYLKTNQKGKIVVNALKTSKEEEAKLFVAINDKQSRVPPNLIWDLIGIMQPATEKGIISNTVRYMNENPKSFFYQKVKFSTSRQKNMVNLSGLCRGIDEKKALIGNKYISTSTKKSIFYFDKDNFDDLLHEKLGDIISSYFDNLTKALGEDFSEKYFEKEYLYYINLRLCFLLIYHYINNSRSFSVSITGDFFKDLAKIIKNTDYTGPGGKALSSYGQYSNLEKRYILKLRKAGYKNFAPDTKIEVDEQLGKQIVRIEKNIHRLSILLWEEKIGKNYLNQFYNKNVVQTAYDRSELDDKHPQFVIPTKMSLETLMNKRTDDPELDAQSQKIIVNPGHSKFSKNQVVSNVDFKFELKRLKEMDKKKDLPTATIKVRFFDKYLSKYMLAKNKLGGLVSQEHEILSFFNSIYTYRSNMESIHDADRNVDIDELFHDITIKAYKNMAEILDISFRNACNGLEKEFNKD